MSSPSPKSFSAPQRLEGSTNNEAGGLIVKKKQRPDDEIFAKPSLLGLQKLAEEKRKQAAEKERNRKKKSSDDEDDDSSDEDERSNKNTKYYRSYKPETPSNPGGVSETYKRKQEHRRERGKDERKMGIYAETDRKNNRPRHHESSSERKERSSSKKRDRVEREGGESSRRYADWESTPSSSTRTGNGHTPILIVFDNLMMNCLPIHLSYVFDLGLHRKLWSWFMHGKRR